MIRNTGSLSGIYIGAGPFSPAMLPGLINFSAADSGGALKTGGSAAANGEAVETWTKSGGTGNNLQQLTGTAQPTYNTGIINGKPVLTFDGTSDYMSSTISITGTTATWGCVFRSVTATASDRLAALWDGSSNDWNNATTGVFLLQSSATNWRTSRNNADRVSYTAAASPFNCILISIYDGTNSIVYHNGTQQTPVACTCTFGATTFFLGAGYSAGISFWANIQVAEQVLCSSALSATEATALSNYWNSKYAVY